MFSISFYLFLWYVCIDFGKKGDPMDVLSSYQANVERDIPDGRAIWDDIMTRHGRESQYWLDYIAYVRCISHDQCIV